MKYLKRSLLLLLLVTILTGCNEKKEEPIDEPKNEPKDNVSIMEYGDYKNITLDEIEKITIYRITIAGANPTDYTDKTDIESIYNGLKSLIVGEKTEMACEDNGTDYVFKMKNGEEYTIVTECDWFIIGKDRYMIERLIDVNQSK